MSYETKKINVSGLQNAEAVISQIFNEEGFYRLVKVTNEGDNITLFFEQDFSRRYHNYAKQLSKKKYSSIESYVCERYDTLGVLIGIVSLKTKWILFFNRR